MSQTKKSESARAFAEDGACKTHVGGQALIEGVMMRGKYNWAVAVREPDGGIYLEEHDLVSGKKKNGWLYWPFVRGCRAFVESLALGFKALEIAALHAYGEEEDAEGKEGASAELASVEAGCAEAASADAVSAEPVWANSDSVEVSAGVEPAGISAGAESVEVSYAVDAGAASYSPEGERPFSWKDDFGRPDTVIDALGAQRSLELVTESAVSSEVASVSARESVGSPDSDKVGKAADGDDDDMVEFGHKEMVFSMVLGLVLGVVLFVVAPALLTNLIVGEYDENTLLWNVVDGVIRVGVFVFYIWIIGRMEEIKRMFCYHGAEHKTIHCFEHGLPLTVENARTFPCLHVRCGTAFLIMVMLIAILVYTIVPIDRLILLLGVPDGAIKLVLVILVRIALMPLIAGISYEITVKWAGNHPENPLVKVILWPGMQMQRLTTKEPDDGMLECAIASMKMVLDREDLEAAKAAEGSGAA